MFASKSPHCLYDLLLAHQLGELGGDLVLVVSNHDELRPVAGHFGVPFEHVPVDARQGRAPRRRRSALLAGPAWTWSCSRATCRSCRPSSSRAGRRAIINIHHSFLPAFVGAKPYHQAKERGVKVIGATAHYVTSELDQGPIIEQDVGRVSHRDDVEELVRKGGELERRVLTRAVRLHLRTPRPGLGTAGRSSSVSSSAAVPANVEASSQRISPKPAIRRASSISKRHSEKSPSAK